MTPPESPELPSPPSRAISRRTVLMTVPAVAVAAAVTVGGTESAVALKKPLECAADLIRPS